MSLITAISSTILHHEIDGLNTGKLGKLGKSSKIGTKDKPNGVDFDSEWNCSMPLTGSNSRFRR